MSGSRTAGYVAVLALALIWGCNWTVVKLAMTYTTPFVFSVLRSIVGIIAVLLVLLWMRRSLRPTTFVPTVIIGLTATSAFFIGQAISVSVGSVGKASVLFYCFPFMIALLARPALRERIALPTWIGLVLAAIGIFLIAAPSLRAHAAPASILAPLVTALAWAIGAVYTKWVRTALKIDVLGLTAWQGIYGTIPLAIVTAALPAQHVAWHPPLVAAALYTGVFATAIAMILWIFALDRLAVSAVGLASLLTPLVSIAAAYVVLGEMPTQMEALGIICIVVALVVHAIPDLMQARARERTR